MTVTPRPPLAARLTPPQSLAVDGFLATAYGAVVWRVLVPDVPSTWVVAGTVALVVAALVLGRRHPLAALVVALVSLCMSPIASAVAFVALIPVCYSLYNVTTRSRAAVGLLALAGCVLGSVTTALPGFEHRGAVIPFALVFVTTWTIGYAVRQQRSYLARLAEHHRELAHAEIARARRNAAEGRLVMARELHDVVAHNMSVITVQAGYGHLVIDRQPEQARAALDVIEQTGRKTLIEMRTLMEVLRRDDVRSAGDAPLTPAPGLADLDTLIADTARAGVTVDLVVRGPRRALPAGVDLSAYRIVQEALTNVIKHAAVAEARAVIDFGADELTIDITDSGAGAIPGGASAPGHGLIGMQERVKAYGGRLCAEPLPGKGFRVSAHLPLGKATA